MDGGAWWAAVHGVAKNRTRLSDFTFTFHCHAWEKEMATHSSVLAWRIPGTGEPGGLPSMGSQRVGHDSSDLAAAASKVNTIWEQDENWTKLIKLKKNVKFGRHLHFMEIYEFGMKQRKTTADSYRSFYLGVCTYIFFGSGGGLLTYSHLRQEHWHSEYHFFFLWKPQKHWGFSGSSADEESAYNAGDPGLIPGLGRSAGEGIGYPFQYSWASLVAQLVKNPPAMWETWVQSLSWEDPLEKVKATHSSILAWRIPWTV